ncbi:MAG: hypothetical protein RIE08_11930 [Acidimicrobiales bacterium]
MASITVDDDVIRIELTRFEKIMGILGDQEIPLSAVTAVSVEHDSRGALRGMRLPGTAVPGRTWLGTWRGRGHKTMVRIRKGEPAVSIAADGQSFTHYLVSVESPEAVVAQIAEGSGQVLDR